MKTLAALFLAVILVFGVQSPSQAAVKNHCQGQIIDRSPIMKNKYNDGRATGKYLGEIRQYYDFNRGVECLVVVKAVKKNKSTPMQIRWNLLGKDGNTVAKKRYISRTSGKIYSSAKKGTTDFIYFWNWKGGIKYKGKWYWASEPIHPRNFCIRSADSPNRDCPKVDPTHLHVVE